MRSLRVGALLLILTSCSNDLGRFPSEPEAPEEEQEKLLLSSAESVQMLADLFTQAIVIPFPGGAISIDYRNGFHTVQVVMFGSQRSLQLQFQDSAGRPMVDYNAFTTKAIRLITTTEDRNGLRHFDLLIRGVDFAADNYVINGNGRVERRDTVWNFFANGIVLAKVGSPYPLRGTVSLEIPHASGSMSSATFRFNGSRIVDGTLISGSVSAYFTLDLVSLELTPVEPPS